MDSTANYVVKLGFWTNWLDGRILGATMTLTRQNGGFLIAFLAVFVGMVGKSFWRLGCFAVHRYLSSAEPQDGLYHQRQAILRNSDTAFDGIVRLLTSMQAWKSNARARKPLYRLLPMVFAALIVTAGFGVASIFSSSVTSESLNQVLLTGKRCGVYVSSKTQNITKEQVLSLPYKAERVSKFLDYGRQCYSDKTQVDRCNLYAKPRLPLMSTRGVKCPFGNDICKLKDNNLVMDTGKLDSLEHLGINLAPEYRFQLRFVTTCAPLKTQGYTSDYNDKEYGAVKRYLYGTDRNDRQISNFTYEIPLSNGYQPKDNSTSFNFPRMEYQLGSRFFWAGVNESLAMSVNTWKPIDALKKLDADLHILFMSAPGIWYSAPVADPWFSAQTPKPRFSAAGDKVTFWQPDEPLGVMACTQQVQYCNPNLSESESCEPLRGIFDPERAQTWTKIFHSEDALSTINWVDWIWLHDMSMLSDVVFYVGASALRARYSFSGPSSGPLPDNQWQIEAEHLNKGSLASLQNAFVEAANGIPEALEDFRIPPTADQTMAKMMCANQKIVSNRYSSFNVMGVSLILIVGLVITILDLGLAPTLAWWQHRKYRKTQAQDADYGIKERPSHPLANTLEWSQTSVLQLQRLAHESAGYGDWSGCDETVPVTKSGELLACLELGDLKHPRYQIKKDTSLSDLEAQEVLSRAQSMERHYGSMDLPASEFGAEGIIHGTRTLEEEGEQYKPGSVVSLEIANETEIDDMSHSALAPVRSEQIGIGLTKRVGEIATGT